MQKSIVLLAVIAGLAACTATDEPNFARMSDIELARYNLNLDPVDKVHCQKQEARTGSYIRTRVCYRVNESGHVTPVTASRAFTFSSTETGRHVRKQPKKVRVL